MPSYLESIMDEIFGGIPRSGGGLGRGYYGGTGYGDSGGREIPFNMYDQKREQQAALPRKRKRLVDVLFDDLREAPFRPTGSGGSSGGSSLNPIGGGTGGGHSTTRPPRPKPEE